MDIFIVDITGKIDESVYNPYQKKNFRDEAKRRQHCLAYYALDKICEQVYKLDYREIEYVGNKPYLKYRQMQFSMSHCGKFAVFVFSKSNCGIDIEEIKDRDFREISERMGFKNCNTLEDFYKAWTEYEAKYKLGHDFYATVSFKNENYQICAVSEDVNENFQIYLKNITDFSKVEG